MGDLYFLFWVIDALLLSHYGEDWDKTYGLEFQY